MVTRCVVPACNVSKRKRESGVKCYRFPLKEEERCKQWLRAVNNPKYDENTPVDRLKNIRVCSLHFTSDDYGRNMMIELMGEGERKLKPTAVPSINLDTIDDEGQTPSTELYATDQEEQQLFSGVPQSTSKKALNSPTTYKTRAKEVKSKMCSVVGCGSWRRSAQRFKLPEDPERRLEWVQFIFEVNGQRLKESSWTDITICNEHFTGDCFVNLTSTGTVQLKSSAVPSLCVKSEPDEPLESPQYVEPMETTDGLKTCNSPTSYSKKSKSTLTGSRASPASSGVSESDQMQQKVGNIVIHKEKTELLQKKGMYAVNESCLLQLFRRKCPSCGCKLQMEKVTYGVLIILNQQCLQCDYRNQWKSQVNASVPTAEGGGGTGVTPETQQEMPTDDNPSSTAFSEIVTFSDEESDASEEEEGDDDGMSSDGDWKPTEDVLLAEELTKDSDGETEGEEEEDFNSPGGLKINELCTECGSFFTIHKPHTCEHKIKPYSCNVCGKRCVTETSLKNHSRIHDETYDHPCKYCHTTFKTRVDKLKHEQIHQDSKDPYKCPDCPETFATNKKRRIHLANHRGPKEFKCGVCGIEFKDVHHLRRHSVVHTGLKPYTCSVCQRGFNQSNHLKSHMRLHTGERPYKCRHCDKSFNHNVSLKSHVQRYHSSSSGRERKKIDERASDTGDAEESGNKKGPDSEFDNVEEEQDAQEEVQKKKTPKSRKRNTGRPRGRPKRNAAGSLDLGGEKEGQRSNTKTAKSKRRKLKKTGSSDEESEDEQSDSDVSFDSAEEEEEEEEKETARKSTKRSSGRPENDSDISFDSAEEEEEEEEKETVRKSIGKSRGRPKNDSDTDFDPEEETKKKRYSSKSSGKRRGRPTKSLAV